MGASDGWLIRSNGGHGMGEIGLGDWDWEKLPVCRQSLGGGDYFKKTGLPWLRNCPTYRVQRTAGWRAD